MALNNRYDFVLLFDVKDGNPNGDPDAGNLPRVDAETGKGLVTDVCIKRKVRNFVGLTKNCARPFDIYVKEKAVLGRAHTIAFEELGISLGKESRVLIPKELQAEFDDLPLPEGMEMGEFDEDKTTHALEAGKLKEYRAQDGDQETLSVIIVAADADVKTIKTAIKEAKLSKEITSFLNSCLKEVKPRKPKAEEVSKGRDWMCQKYFDIRTFGAVMSLKSAPNCGQVRGPVQLTFARSVDPIVAQEHSITRMAVATEAEAEKQSGDNRTMGRKFTVPYGLYVAHGFVSAHLANQTGFNEDDLELLWQSLVNMFEHDRSAARGEMATRGLYVFKHDGQLGNAPAYSLFERIQPRLKDGIAVPRSFDDYQVNVNDAGLPSGVTLERKA
ncbi:MAG: type I-C CRISPR-associated protein Cas7/Csd2 [Nitrosomonas sp.]|nr:type I-C CRISPR-associated protein Cas7/Csd2 [Nitrosomonas sp.]MBP6075439.1 type I-C CRISPR-associated protein Cas7/Csd2 [Nitrosomonas sp.]